MKSYQINQINLISAITNELSRQHPVLPLIIASTR